MKDIILNEIIELPLLALRGIVIYPGMSAHFEVGRKKSINAINCALSENKQICLVTQKDVRKDEPVREDIYDTCVIANIKQQLNISGDSVRVLVEGISRAKIVDFNAEKTLLSASLNVVLPVKTESDVLTEALIREANDAFDKYASISSRMSADVLMNIMEIDDAGRLADYMASNIKLPIDQKQKILDELDPVKRLKLLVKILRHEIQVITIESELHKQVNEAMDRNQRDYYLREELKAIYAELGEDEDPYQEVEEYKRRIKALALDTKSEAQLLKEASKLMKMQTMSPESTVTRNYLDTVLELPWNKFSKDKIDLSKIKAKLDKDHYGLEAVKERILEFLAVRKLCDGYKSQIICLIGPPGVGKTSVAKSIADAIGRKFARISLGGVHDEAEIRGHRKTYIGAMPGRIINAFKTSGTSNPLILFDEIDKLCSDMRSDPTSAMLEVLDAEQNKSFRDNYIEVPFDISRAIFITTANTLDTIPHPLLDRMEIVELTSYTPTQKFHIAKDYLLKRQIKENGLSAKDILIKDDAIRAVIEFYTRESGVRRLEREIAKICRKTAARIVSGQGKQIVTEKNLSDYLGEKRYVDDRSGEMPLVGVANGLAWTAVGGDVLKIESQVFEGNGKVKMTGSIGDVMKESVDAAVSYIRANCEALGIDRDFYKNKDIHIHFPEGAIPKDGPSAGITIAVSLISELSKSPVRNDLTMTGEITLKGNILPIGGLNEKLSAAARLGYKNVIIPSKNGKDLEQVDKEVLSQLNILFVSHMDEVAAAAICEYKNDFKCDKDSHIPVKHKNNYSESVIRQ